MCALAALLQGFMHFFSNSTRVLGADTDVNDIALKYYHGFAEHFCDNTTLEEEQ